MGSATAVTFQFITDTLRKKEFVVDVLISELDTLSQKMTRYRQRSGNLKTRENEVLSRMTRQIEDTKRLPKVIQTSLSSSMDNDPQLATVRSLMTERSVYDDLLVRINRRFFSLVKDRASANILREKDMSLPGNRALFQRLLHPGVIRAKRGQLIGAVGRVENGIRGDARKDIREYLYGVMFTFASNQRGLMNSMEFNYMIMGQPGTGKSYMVRAMAGFFHAVGIMVTDRILVLDKSDLIAGYIGQSAPKTRSVMFSALEGFLFLDEAYSLAGCDYTDDSRTKVSKRDPYGTEAIDQIVDLLSEIKGLIVFAVAGYPKDMRICFLGSNTGLARRFKNKWDLQRFSRADLLDIFVQNLRDIDSTNNYWFKRSRIMFPDIRAAQDVADSVEPYLAALDSMNLLTAQAADINELAHDLYNLLVQSYPDSISVDSALLMFNTFLKSQKDLKRTRLLSIDAYNVVTIADEEGVEHEIETSLE
jgi:hypothetical protein